MTAVVKFTFQSGLQCPPLPTRILQLAAPLSAYRESVILSAHNWAVFADLSRLCGVCVCVCVVRVCVYVCVCVYQIQPLKQLTDFHVASSESFMRLEAI